jgi:glycosyltransferase involved in cell wall biosynthesis
MKAGLTQMIERPVYSIIAPVYNEEGNITALFERVSSVMDALNEAWELILVNDGSHDSSLEQMRALQAAHPTVKVISFSRNFGHQIAVTAGLDHAAGQAMILIDADLQDPPEIIPQMIERWKQGFDVVYAIREGREGESWFKIQTAKLFYRLIYRIAEIEIPQDTGDFRLMDRRVVNALHTMREHNPYIRGMTSWVGFNQTGVRYVREERNWGETKYPLRKMVRFALDAITGFSYFPLQIAMYASLILAFVAVLAIPVVALLRLATGQLVFEGQATTLIVLLLLSSFQLFFFFIMGQYIARIYDEVRGRPLYVVSDRYGFDHGEDERPVADSVPSTGTVDSPGKPS